MRKKQQVAARVGRRVRELRKAAKLTQQELALKAGLNVKYVGELENGHRDIRLTTLDRLGKALHLDLADLFRFTESDVTLDQIDTMLRGRDEAFRAHLLRLLREMLLLVEASR
ncbi:MAG: helix-turn-helix transcriptional regulator [Candidatus Wallbacteria bacterium]|nr:helix-turn-helix transcriptional regulator [Candidatus Wallbacteria bacterium]